MFIYFSQKACTTCNINKLYDWDPIEKELEEYQFIYILSIVEEHYDEVMEYLNRQKFKNKTILIDNNSFFKNRNPFIVNNHLLHVFGTDKNNIIKVVGDPLYNIKTKNMYRTVLIKL